MFLITYGTIESVLINPTLLITIVHYEVIGWEEHDNHNNQSIVFFDELVFLF